MRCKKFILKLDRYISNELSQDESRQVEEHLTKCPSCKEELFILLNIKSKISHFCPKYSSTAPTYAKILSHIESMEEKKEKIKHFLKFDFSPAALVLVAILFFIITFTSINSINTSSSQEFMVKDISLFEILYFKSKTFYYVMMDLEEK